MMTFLIILLSPIGVIILYFGIMISILQYMNRPNIIEKSQHSVYIPHSQQRLIFTEKDNAYIPNHIST